MRAYTDLLCNTPSNTTCAGKEDCRIPKRIKRPLGYHKKFGVIVNFMAKNIRCEDPTVLRAAPTLKKS